MSDLKVIVPPLKGNVKSRVKTMLLFDEAARDDVNLLYMNYIIAYHNINRKKETFDSFFAKLMTKEIPSLEYIARLKRMLQNQHSDLRGAKWAGEV